MAAFFVGRRDELKQLNEMLATARTGQGCAVLVSGEAGIGKTSMAEELAKAAAWMGVRALWGPAIEAEGAPPFWPWRQALRGLIDLGERTQVPDLAESGSARFRFFERVATVVCEAAEPHGLLVVLDDLHWADAGSLRLLQVIAAQLPGSRVMLLGTFRSPAPGEGGPLTDALPGLLRERAVTQLALRGLDAADTELLLLQLLGQSSEPELVRRARDQSDGNPLYLIELGESLRAGGFRGRLTLGLREITRRRLHGASESGLDMLGSAAVVGREFRLDLLSAVTGLGMAELLESLGEATSLHLVEEQSPMTWRFTHALLREVLYEDLSAAQRTRRHLKAAEVIGALGPSRRDSLMHAWAHHLRQALPLGDQRQTLDVTLRAASAAERQLAYEQAAEEYAEAAILAASTDDVPSRGRILLSRARCLYRAGAVAAAWQATSQAAEEARASGDGRLLAEAALVVRGVMDEAITVPLFKLCEKALVTLAGADPVLEARLLGQMAVAGQQPRVGLAPPGLADRAMHAARVTGDPEARFLALQAKEVELIGAPGLAARLEVAQEALRLAEETRDPAVDVWVRSWRLTTFWELGRRRDLDRELEALRIAAEESREPLGLWRLAMVQASVAVMDGRYQAALDGVDRALAIGRRGGYADTELMAIIVRSHIGVRTGLVDVEEAVRFAMSARRASERLWGANILADVNRVDEARELWRMSGVDVASLPRDPLWLLSLHSMARVAAAVADVEAAPAIYEALVPFADRHAVAAPVGGYDGPVALNVGRLALLLERWDDAEGWLREAVASAATVGSPPFEAIARWELAGMLRRRGRPRDRAAAGALLEQALTTATRLGMRLLEGWASADLEEHRHPHGQATPLSVRELEVASLVSEGLTNRAIAQRLHLSERTAENHVKNILDKLGMDSRTQIAAWMAGGTRI